MAEQKTIGIRGTEDTKTEIEQLAADIKISQKELLEKMIATFKRSLVRESLESLGKVKELDLLKHYLTRIEETYVGLTKANLDLDAASSEKINRLEFDLAQAKAQVLDAQEKLNKANQDTKEQVDAVRAEAALTRENADKEIGRIKESLVSTKEAQEQASRLASLAEKAAAGAEEKAAMLEEMASLSEKYKGEAQRAVEELKALQHKLDLLTERTERSESDKRTAISASEEKGERIKELESLLETQKNEVQRLAEEVKSLNREIERLTERAGVELERAVLAAQRASMEEIGRLRDALASGREELAKCREDNIRLEVASRTT